MVIDMEMIGKIINEFKIFKNDVKKGNKFKKLIPNILTFSRFIAPFIIVPIYFMGYYKISLILACFFALTDAFDGFLARKFKTTSDFGKTLDTICDKVFALGLIIPILDKMVFAFILEIIIAIININSLYRNNNPKSSYLGKFKTTLLSICIAAIYLFKAININVSLKIFILITNFVQLITAINYQMINIQKNKEKSLLA